VSNVLEPKSNAESEVAPVGEAGKRTRRRFSPEKKAQIVREADACKDPGEIGALLRRENIHSSHLHNWRVRMRQSGLAGLVNKQPGAKPSKDARDRIIEQLAAKNARLDRELQIARSLLELQAKAREILGMTWPNLEAANKNDSPPSSANGASG
jgi:transposase